MKASSAVTELRQLGLVFIATGVATIALTAANADRWRGNGNLVFVAVVSGFVAAAIIGHVAWTLRELRRPRPAPERVVILPWWGTLLRRVVPSAIPAAATAVFLAVTGGSWLLGGAYLTLGVVLVVEAAIVAGIERRRDARVLRFQSRYFLAH